MLRIARPKSMGASRVLVAYWHQNSCRQLSSTSRLCSRNQEDPSRQDARIWTVPNALTLGRLAAAPAIAWWTVQGHYELALGAFVLSGASDLADGWIARRFNQHSALGSVLDPLADKALITLMTLSLAAASLIPGTWLPLAALIVARDAGLIATFVYYRWHSIPPAHRTLRQLFNPAFMTLRVQPSGVSKINTALQLLLGAASLCVPLAADGSAAAAALHTALPALWWTVGATTLLSGASYARSRYRVLQNLR